MHKIVLIRPNYYSHLITPPLGIGYMSGYLKNNGLDVEIIDGLNLNYSVKETVDQCHGAVLVGISCMSAYFSAVKELSKELKKRAFKVVIGGPHATALPDLTLQETQADYVAVGEGELSLLQLAQCTLNNDSCENIPGIFSNNNKKLRLKRPLIKELDSLPYPDWKSIDPRIYKKAPHGGLVKSFPVAPLTSTRGCPFECTFCASPVLWNRTIRYRSPENVVDEIEYLVKEFNVREVHFEDDNLTLKKEHIEGICNLILKRKIKINWATPNGVRVDTLDLELLKLMKKSGCYFIAFGIESGNQGILDQAKKRTDLGTISKIAHLAKKTGMVTQGFFIFGLPGETERTIKETIDFAKKLPLDKAQFLLLDILAGSELWNNLIKNNPVSWDYNSYQEATWVPEGLSREALNRAPGSAFRSFFLRPRQMLFLLKYFKFSQIPFIIKRAIDFNVIPFPLHSQKERK